MQRVLIWRRCHQCDMHGLPFVDACVPNVEYDGFHPTHLDVLLMKMKMVAELM